MSVAATGDTNQLASFSNYGAKSVSIAAPGVDILSTTPNNTYTVESGTSMAAPHVTAALALVWGLHPTWTYQQVISQVLTTVTKESSMTGEIASGGMLNLAAAVGYVAPPPPAPPTPPVTATPLQVLSVSPASSQGPWTNLVVQFNNTVDVPSVTGGFTLVGPTGKAIAIQSVIPVANTTDRSVEINFSAQTTAGAYILTLLPQIHDRMTPVDYLAAPFTIRYTVAAAGSAPTPVFQVVSVTAPGAQTQLSNIVVQFNNTVDMPSVTTGFTLTGPNGKAIAIQSVTPIANTTDRSVQITFAAQSTTGTYTLTLLPQIHDRLAPVDYLSSSFTAALKVTGSASSPPSSNSPSPFLFVAVSPTGSQKQLSSIVVQFNSTVDMPSFTSGFTLTGPNGKAIAVQSVAPVANTTDRQILITFAAQTAPGTYTLTLSTQIHDRLTPVDYLAAPITCLFTVAS